FARSTSSVNGAVLGHLDPTMLASGTYILRLTAENSGGNVSTFDRTVSVAGDLKLGNFRLSFGDLSIPVTGIPITITRTYDTLQSDRSQDFGFGWRLEFADTDLRTSVGKTGFEEDGLFNPFRDRTRVYVTVPGGQREGFTFQPALAPGLAGSFLGILEPQVVAAAGVADSLSVDQFDLRRFDDGSYSDFFGDLPYNPADPAFGGHYTLTTKEGVTYDLDGLTGRLNTVADANHNALHFSDSGIVSDSGQEVAFQRDPQGRITAVIDPSGQKITYQYDGQGNLISTTDR